MRHLAAAIDTSNSDTTSQRSVVYRCNGVFLACFQTTHVWGNLVSSLLLSHGQQGKAGSLQVYDEIYAPSDGTGAYCGTYDTCTSLQPATSLTTANISGSCTDFLL